MNEHPILMNTPMIYAYKKGVKSMTRRLNGLDMINENPNDWRVISSGPNPENENDERIYVYLKKNESETWTYILFPYGKPFDNLWFRETFCNINKTGLKPEFYYFADTIEAEDYEPNEWKWKPSIYMPRIAARFLPKILSFRLERLQNISENDAKSEGVYFYGWDDPCQNDYKNYLYDDKGFCDDFGLPTAIDSYSSLWDLINDKPKPGKKSYPWALNPWVWVIEFENEFKIKY